MNDSLPWRFRAAQQLAEWLPPLLAPTVTTQLFGFEREGWRAEFESIGEYLDGYGPRMPQALKDEQQRIAATLA